MPAILEIRAGENLFITLGAVTGLSLGFGSSDDVGESCSELENPNLSRTCYPAVGAGFDAVR